MDARGSPVPGVPSPSTAPTGLVFVGLSSISDDAAASAHVGTTTASRGPRLKSRRDRCVSGTGKERRQKRVRDGQQQLHMSSAGGGSSLEAADASQKRQKRPNFSASGAVKFSPPTTEVTADALPLLYAGPAIPCFPFIAQSSSVGSSSDPGPIGAGAPSAPLVSSASQLVPLIAALAPRLASPPHTTPKDVLGRALVYSHTVLASLTVSDVARHDVAAIVAACTALAAHSAALPPPGDSGTPAPPRSLLEKAFAVVTDPSLAPLGIVVPGAAALTVGAIAAALDALIRTALPACSPLLVVQAFALACGGGPGDVHPLPTPLTLIEDAVTLVRGALLSSRCPIPALQLAKDACAGYAELRKLLAPQLGPPGHSFPGPDPSQWQALTALHTASDMLCLWTHAHLPGLWSAAAPRAVAAAIVYCAAGMLLPVSILQFLKGGPSFDSDRKFGASYEKCLDSTSLKVEYSKANHCYVAAHRWIDGYRCMGLIRDHAGETARAISSLMSALTRNGIAAGNHSAFAYQLFAGSASASLAPPSPFPKVLEPSSATPCVPLASSIPGLCILQRLTDGSAIACATLSANAVEDGSSPSMHMHIRFISERELLLSLRIHAARWDDMSAKLHDGRKKAKEMDREREKGKAGVPPLSLAVPSKDTSLRASELLLCDDTWMAEEVETAHLVPSSSSASSSSVLRGSDSVVAFNKVSRHPHFLVPLHLLMLTGDDTSTSASASAGAAASSSTAPVSVVSGVYEYCPHTLASIAMPVSPSPSSSSSNSVLACLSLRTRHRLAYQIMRALNRADDRSVVLNGLCPTSVLLDAGGHVRLDVLPHATVVQERGIGKVMMLLGQPQPGVADHKQRKEGDKAQELGLLCKKEGASSDWSSPSATGHLLLQLTSRPTAALELDMACVAPELLLGLPCPLPASDAWSLGVCIAIAHTGQSPFPVPSVDAVAAAIISMQPSSASGCDASSAHLQARIVAAAAGIEAVVGPTASAWPFSQHLPAAAWLASTMSALRSSHPTLLPPAAVVPAGSTPITAIHARCVSMGLHADVADLVSRCMSIDPTARSTMRDIASSAVWKAAEMKESEQLASAISAARLAVASRVGIKLAPDTASADVDAALLAAMPSTRWPEATVMRPPTLGSTSDAVMMEQDMEFTHVRPAEQAARAGEAEVDMDATPTGTGAGAEVEAPSAAAAASRGQHQEDTEDMDMGV